MSFAGISSSGKQSEGSFVEVNLKIANKLTNTLVLFSDDISDNGYGILGQQGFFNNYNVSFKYKKREIIVAPNSSKAKN